MTMAGLPIGQHMNSIWFLVSLRPVGRHQSLRLAVEQHGGQLLALSPWQLKRRQDAVTRQQLMKALTAKTVICTSAEAVNAAQALVDLHQYVHLNWLCPGQGTKHALEEIGIRSVHCPEQMDTAGMLALPVLDRPTTVGILTAPDGRAKLAETLQLRGAQIRVAEVYERQLITLSPEQLSTLQAVLPRCVLAVSSILAVQRILEQCTPILISRLQYCPVVASSDRIVAFLRSQGFLRIQRAPGPLSSQLAATAVSIIRQSG